ncbi:MAG: efflux RND transporter periplasmic adaptor subunit [Oleiphilaceae bacterium]|nr:efflux RND transporter periplasmic adaptor subunit [Oleiphilaceae bacterium]
MTGRHASSAVSHQARGRQPRTVLLLLPVLLLSACGDTPEDSGGGGQGEKPAPPVTVQTVTKTRVDINEQYAGRVRGAREVAVRNRVAGVLKERLYQEGQWVEKGEPLFQIHREPFEVALQAAQAQKQSAQADLNQAEREWRRVSRLYKQKAVSERDRDMALSALELARASMAVAESGISRARLELSYTRVEAPISGVTGLETLSEGALLEKGTSLTHMTQLDPVHVRFAIPQSDARLQDQARRAMGGEGSEEGAPEATLILSSGEEYEHRGVIDLAASTLDAQTGTVRARAVFDTPERQVVPGEFVRVRMTLETLEEAVLLPTRALGDSPQGRRVFVVDEEDRARQHIVKTGPVIGDNTLILDGLDEGDSVVVNGIAALRGDGMQVSVSSGGEESQETKEEPQDSAGEPEEDNENGQGAQE